MDDSDRLERERADAVERLLLRAGRAGAPPGARDRALAVVSAAMGSALVTSQAAAGGLIAGAAKAGSVATLHWIGIISLGGIGAVAGAMLLGHASGGVPPSSSARAAPSGAQAEPPRPERYPMVPPASGARSLLLAPSADPDLPAPSPTVAIPEIARRTTSPAVPQPISDSPRPSVGAEIALLDEARGALSRGQPARALSILDAYVARFPRATLAPEATLLRVDALVHAGDRPAAERAAAALVANHLDSPYAGRVQSLLALPNP